MKITNVRVNGIVNPVGYLFDKVEISWNVTDTDSKKQTAAKIEVATDAAFTDIIATEESEELDQAGEALDLSLVPRTRFYLRITVTGDAGDTAVNDEAYFETGKMEEPWTAKWIAPQKDDHRNPELRKKFTIAKDVVSARWYGTGVGLFELCLNGRKVGDEFLTPYNNNYEDGIQVITFPVEDYLAGGANEMTMLLSEGWYMGVYGLDEKRDNYGSRMAAIGELHLGYADGSEEIIATDASWQYRGSCIEKAGIYYGEDYNRLLWEEDGNDWLPVDVLEHPEEDPGTANLRYDHLTDRVSIPIRHHETLKIREIITTPKGDTVLDFGQNASGIPVITKKLPRGAKVSLQGAEILQDGEFYHGNYIDSGREARAMFVYTSDGTEEAAHPHFTYWGGRYLKVTGWPGEITKDDVEIWVLYSDLTRTGWIETANAKVNRLYENTIWGQRSNFLDMPTDCPQRAERLGWTGDIQVFAPTASYHMDTRAFLHKFLRDIHEEQGHTGGAVPNFLPNFGHAPMGTSVWGDVATFIPQTLYRFYGSLEEQKLNYPMMKEWVDWIHAQDEEHGGRRLWDFGFTFGDWLAQDGVTPSSFKGGTDDGYISSVYYYESSTLVAETAERLGLTEDAKKYRRLAEEVKQAVLHEYFSPSGRLAINTQAAIIIALKFGLYIDREKLVDQFRARLQFDCNRIRCGFVGAPLMCLAMAECGMYEKAYDFLLNESFPGWLFEVNLGATTIWERWNSVGADGKINPAGMNSLNHYAYGSIMEFVYAYIAGIRAAEPGFAKAIIAPHPDVRIPWVNGRYDSVNGTYVCNWKIEADGTFTAHVEIPFGCTATVELPGDPDGAKELDAGSYDFRYTPSTDFRAPYSGNTSLARLAQDDRVMAILGKYVPPVAGMAQGALHGDPEASANTLGIIRGMFFLGFDPAKMEQAIQEICALTVDVA